MGAAAKFQRKAMKAGSKAGKAVRKMVNSGAVKKKGTKKKAPKASKRTSNKGY